MTQVRLRQVALVARQLAPVEDELRAAFELGDPFRDSGVAEFGLENAVFAVGDTFLEVVSPVRDGTTAGRYLDRRGGDAGYMAIFQVPEIDKARRRISELGVRVVWQADLPDIAGTHLHPRDVPGAIVSVDWSQPPQAWRWAGPAWTGGAPPGVEGGIIGLTVATTDPAAAASKWASVLAIDSPGHDVIELDRGRQMLRFVAASAERAEGICEVTLAPQPGVGAPATDVRISGVRFRVGAD